MKVGFFIVLLVVLEFFALHSAGDPLKSPITDVGLTTNKQLGEICQEDLDCKIINAECKVEGPRKICRCGRDFYQNENNECLPQQNLQDPCTSSSECLIANSECREAGSGTMKCLCKEDFFQVGFDQCNPKKILQESCSNDLECKVLNSECRDAAGTKKCVCSIDYYAVGFEHCEERKNLEGSCRNNIECKSENSECRDDGYGKICACKPGHLPSEDKTTCLEIGELIGSPCDSDDQCTVQNSRCHDIGGHKVCACESGYVSSSDKDKCLLEADLGESCEQNAQCTVNHSICAKNGTCQCNEDENFIPDPTGKECISGPTFISIGKQCKDSSKCGGYPNSECSTAGICVCVGDTITSTLLNDCLPIVNTIGGPCKEQQQCQQGELGTLSVCVQGVKFRRGQSLCLY